MGGCFSVRTQTFLEKEITDRFGGTIGRAVALTVEEIQMAFDILSALYLENTESNYKVGMRQVNTASIISQSAMLTSSCWKTIPMWWALSKCAKYSVSTQRPATASCGKAKSVVSKSEEPIVFRRLIFSHFSASDAEKKSRHKAWTQFVRKNCSPYQACRKTPRFSHGDIRRTIHTLSPPSTSSVKECGWRHDIIITVGWDTPKPNACGDYVRPAYLVGNSCWTKNPPDLSVGSVKL